MDRLSELLGQAVQFAYTCWDRIVLSGYIERLQRPENLIWFFQDVVGIAAVEPAVLEQRTKTYKAWVRRVTEEHGIAVLAAPRGVRKEEVVEPYYRRLKGSEGVACVLTSMEQGRTFVSYVPRWKVPSGDANYRLIKACRKRFLHYYWYLRREAPCRIPSAAGRNSKGGSWVQWLTRIREVNGTIACQQSDDQSRCWD
jgi:hypothetical protein